MKRLLALLLLAVFMLPAGAVLKEKDLARTLGVLNAELEKSYKQQKASMARMEGMASAQHEKLVDYMQRSEQIALMLYSQNQDFTFDVSYACQQATDLYRELAANNVPYERIAARIKSEVERYDGLVNALSELPPAVGVAANTQSDSLLTVMADSIAADSVAGESSSTYLLSEQQQADRDRCLVYAKALRENMKRILMSINADKEYYDVVNERVKKLNEYAQTRYRSVQDNIFRNGGDNYLAVLLKLPSLLQRVKSETADKYGRLNNHGATYSQWRGPVIMFICCIIVVYIIIGIALANLLVLIIRFFLKRRGKDRKDAFGGIFAGNKKRVLLITLSMLIFAISVMVIHNVVHSNFVLMATSLMANIAWLALVIYVSLLIRVKEKNITLVEKLYAPFICMAFIVIFFRIVLIPNNLVNIIYPPILLLFTYWQWRMIKAANRPVTEVITESMVVEAAIEADADVAAEVPSVEQPKQKLSSADFIYSFISLGAMVVASCVSLYGYTLLAVEIMLWWVFQLAAIQTITCIYDLLSRYEGKHLMDKICKDVNTDVLAVNDEAIREKMRQGQFIHLTWFYDLINRAIVPICAVASVLLSIYWAADVFDMTAVCIKSFRYNFIDEEGLIQVSLQKLCIAAACFFVFRYINYLLRSMYQYYKLHHSKDDNHNFTLASNVIGILVWGTYFIYLLVLLRVPKSGISIVTAGLATGMGFAMKDLLENFFYGISLMAGRVRVGDYIECDGITGQVDTITYQSTQIITVDGSVIAFLNSALFNKNFKNLTRGNLYIMLKVPVGVAYGSNVQEVRNMLVEAVTTQDYRTPEGLPVMNPDKAVSVAFDGFGDNSVDLNVIAWVLVQEKAVIKARIQETIYDTLNANKIEIPFPQRDVHIIPND